jgi:hypothetical protein
MSVDNIEFDFSMVQDISAQDIPIQTKEIETRIGDLTIELENLAPQTRMLNKYPAAERNFRSTQKEFDAVKEELRQARLEFSRIKEKR